MQTVAGFEVRACDCERPCPMPIRKLPVLSFLMVTTALVLPGTAEAHLNCGRVGQPACADGWKAPVDGSGGAGKPKLPVAPDDAGNSRCAPPAARVLPDGATAAEMREWCGMLLQAGYLDDDPTNACHGWLSPLTLGTLPTADGATITADGSACDNGKTPVATAPDDDGGKPTDGDDGVPLGPSSDLAWSEEFDGPAGSLPDSQWRFFDAWGSGKWRDTHYNERNAYLDGDGNLVLRGRPNGGQYEASYLIGPTFGPGKYVEARIDLTRMDEKGPWAAFWLYDEQGAYDGNPATGTEIDIMEYVRANDWTTTRYTSNNHYAEGGSGSSGTWHEGADPSKGGFHTYGVDWHRDRLDFYFDDRKMWSVTRGVSTSQDQAVILSIEHAAGSSNPWTADAPRVPGDVHMVVDYVRVGPNRR